MFLNTAVWIKVMLAILIAFVVSFALTPVVKRSEEHTSEL